MLSIIRGVYAYPYNVISNLVLLLCFRQAIQLLENSTVYSKKPFERLKKKHCRRSELFILNAFENREDE